MEFQIVSKQIETLEVRVNQLLQKGWKLHGNTFMANHLACQAMTKGEYIRPARLKKAAE